MEFWYCIPFRLGIIVNFSGTRYLVSNMNFVEQNKKTRQMLYDVDPLQSTRYKKHGKE